MDELYRYKKGTVTRRHFLGVTGLGTAMARDGRGNAVLDTFVPSGGCCQ